MESKIQRPISLKIPFKIQKHFTSKIYYQRLLRHLFFLSFKSDQYLVEDYV
jgi:hypothetical protein